PRKWYSVSGYVAWRSPGSWCGTMAGAPVRAAMVVAGHSQGALVHTYSLPARPFFSGVFRKPAACVRTTALDIPPSRARGRTGWRAALNAPGRTTRGMECGMTGILDAGPRGAVSPRAAPGLGREP